MPVYGNNNNYSPFVAFFLRLFCTFFCLEFLLNFIIFDWFDWAHKVSRIAHIDWRKHFQLKIKELQFIKSEKKKKFQTKSKLVLSLVDWRNFMEHLFSVWTYDRRCRENVNLVNSNKRTTFSYLLLPLERFVRHNRIKRTQKN